jgi:AcrR family transcriptional regulator
MSRPRGARDADYELKRAALLRRVSARLGRRNETRPSLRQLAEAAEVTAPTLRHYFGGRDEIVAAVFAEHRRLGDRFIREAAEPVGGLEESVRSFLHNLLQGLQRGPLGEVFAVGFVEGLLNEKLGPACLASMIDPAVEALSHRLEIHQGRGEMRLASARNAALMLIAPLVVACHHQAQMFGAAGNPLDLNALAADMAEAFVRAYGPSN